MNAIKENIIAILVIGGLFIGYIELRAPQMVSAEMDSRGLVKAGDVAQLRTDFEEQKTVHREDRDRMDSKIERIVDILLEE